jgi:hypothetical protein
MDTSGTSSQSPVESGAANDRQPRPKVVGRSLWDVLSPYGNAVVAFALLAVIVVPLFVLLGAKFDLIYIQFEHFRFGLNHEAMEQAKHEAAAAAEEARKDKEQQSVRSYVGQFAVGHWAVEWTMVTSPKSVGDGYCGWNTRNQMLLNIDSFDPSDGYGDGSATITSNSTPQFDGYNHTKGTPQQLIDCGRMAENADPSVARSYKVIFKQSDGDGWTFNARLIQVNCSGVCGDLYYKLTGLPTKEWDLVLNAEASRRMNKVTESQRASR